MSIPVNGSKVVLKYGTIQQYKNISEKNPNTIYFCWDSSQIFVGDTEYTRFVQQMSSPSDELTVPNGSFAIYFDSNDNATIYYKDVSGNKKEINVSGSPIVGEEGTYGQDATATFGGTFTIPQVVVDSTGHLSSVDGATITMPDSPTSPVVGTEGTYGQDTTASFGGNFTIPQVVIDNNGHLSSVSGATITLPDSPTSPVVGVEGNYGLGADNTATFGSTVNIPYISIDNDGHLSSVTGNNLTLPTLPSVGSQGTYGLGSDTTAVYDGSFNIPIITVDSNGNVSSVSQHSLTMPSVGSGYLPSHNPSYTGSLTGENNTIGSNSANIVGSSNSVGSVNTSYGVENVSILGNSNTVYNPSSSGSASYVEIVGDGNLANIQTTFSRGNVILGTGNTVNGSGSSGDGVFGRDNVLTAEYLHGSFILGQGNTLSSDYFGSCGHFVGGLKNYVELSSAGIAQANFIFGDSSTIQTDNATHNNTIFGRYNKIIAESSHDITATGVNLFGESNTVSSSIKSLQLQHPNIVGNYNLIEGNLDATTIFGDSNAFNSDITRTFIFGDGNETTSGQGVSLEDTYIVGRNNTFESGALSTSVYVLGNSNTFNQGSCIYNTVFGSDNLFTLGGGASCSVFGYNNTVQYGITNSRVFGTNNNVSMPNVTVFGDYSDISTTSDKFIFGNGTTSANSNIFTLGFDSTANENYLKLNNTKLTESQLISIIQGGGGSTGTSAFLLNDIAYIPDGTLGGSANELDFYIYNSLGITSFSFTQHGKNFCNPSLYEVGSISENQSIGTDYSAMKSSYANRGRTSDLIKVLPVMTISCDSNYLFGLAQFDKNKQYLGVSTFVAWNAGGLGYNLSLIDDAEYIAIIFKRSDEGNITSTDFEAVNIQVEVGTTMTTFEAYSETSYSVSFPLSVGTVYVANVDAVSGKAVVAICSGTAGNVDCGTTSISLNVGDNIFVSDYPITKCTY